MKNLTITLIQTTLQWESIAANLDMFSQKIAGIKAETDLIILPEMFSTGFTMDVARQAETMDGTAVQWMRQIAAQKNCAVTGSLIIKDGDLFFNRLVWLSPQGGIKHYDKRHLFSLSKEEQIFTAGKEKLIVELKGWKICPLICFDLRFPVWSRNVGGDYDVLIYVANWPERRVQAWKYLLLARAIENQCYVAGVNRVGNDGNDMYHSGDSMVLDPLGNVLYHREHEEEIITLDLNYEELQKLRKSLPFLKDADSFVIEPKVKIKVH